MKRSRVWLLGMCFLRGSGEKAYGEFRPDKCEHERKKADEGNAVAGSLSTLENQDDAGAHGEQEHRGKEEVFRTPLHLGGELHGGKRDQQQQRGDAPDQDERLAKGAVHSASPSFTSTSHRAD